MAVTENNYTGNGTQVLFPFSFEYIETSDIKVTLDGVVTTAYTLANATTVQFNTAPASGVKIRIYRETASEDLSATFFPGSAIRASDLNDNFTQILHLAQETNNNAVKTDGTVEMRGDLDMDGFEVINLGAPTTANSAATKLYVDERLNSGDTAIPSYTEWRFTATGGETTLSGVGENGFTLGYSPGKEFIFLNGALLKRGTDYNAGDGTSIVFTEALTAGDLVDVRCINSIATSVADAAEDIGYGNQFTGQVDRNVASKLSEVFSVKDFGAVGNGIIDDTAAINAAMSAAAAGSKHVVFPPGVYAVTTLTWSGSGWLIEFDNARLYGIAQSAQNQILQLLDFRQSRINNLDIQTDGSALSPIYHGNYGCALRLLSTNPSSPTQFLYIDGLFIRYCRNGIVHGNPIGEAALSTFAQSEIFINRYKQRGVQRPFYGNASNGYLTFTNCIFTPNQFEASSNAWTAADVFCLRNDSGKVVSIGDEYQRSEAGGHCFYGKDVVVIGAVIEQGGVTNYITGDFTISDNVNGFFSSSSVVPFTIDPAATGRLLLSGVTYRRPNGTATSSRSLFVDCKNNNNYRIYFRGCRFKEWAYTQVNSNAHFVLGGKLQLDGVELDNTDSTATSWYFNECHSRFTSADASGASMSTSNDMTTKGGWSGSGVGGFYKATADVPTGSTSCIRFTSSGGTSSFGSQTTTSGSRCTGNKDYIVKCKLKRLGTTDNIRLQVIWFDYGGTQIGAAVEIFAADGSRLDSNGFNQWQELRCPVKAPPDAHYFRLFWISSASLATDVGFTDVEVI